MVKISVSKIATYPMPLQMTSHHLVQLKVPLVSLLQRWDLIWCPLWCHCSAFFIGLKEATESETTTAFFCVYSSTTLTLYLHLLRAECLAKSSVCTSSDQCCTGSCKMRKCVSLPPAVSKDALKLSRNRVDTTFGRKLIRGVKRN